MARLLLLHTGGTLGMAPSGDPSSLAPGPYLDHVLERVPELRDLAELQVEVPFNCDSASMEPGQILDLAAHIRSRAAAFDGVVLIHGTDTMAFTASLLGFLLADLGKPVVITGSQRPLSYVRSDARENLVDAVDLATRGVNEVGIVFGTRWLRGVATDKLSVHRYEAFDSPNLAPLAEIGMDLAIHPQAGKFERRMPSAYGSAFASDIAVYRPFPGMHWELPGEGARGVLIETYGAGNLPMERADLLGLLRRCRERGLPVVATTQCASGSVDLEAYALGRALGAEGGISAGKHTRWAALAKLGLLLGAGSGLDEVRSSFATSWAGEPV
ncbi:MAG: asparaginase [Holophagaceae bacterium]|nr:asparaginase [Holophagaceae bacterium]